MDDEFVKGDKLVLRGLWFHGFHGMKPEERKLGQKFMVDVDAWLDLRAAGKSDNLSDTVSYTDIYCIVREVLEGPPHNLLESVAQLIATTTLSKFSQISAVRVKVGKPHVCSVNGPLDYLGVEIIRCRKADSSVTLSKASDGRVIEEKHGISSSETMPIAISTSKTTKDVGTSEVHPAAKNGTGFTFSIAYAPSTLVEPAMPTSESPLSFNRPAPPTESTAAPVFSPGPFTFSSIFATSESSSLKVGVHSDSKLEISMSVAARKTEAASSASEANPQDAGDLCRQEDDVPSSASATQLSSFGPSMSNSIPNNDSFSSSFASPLLVPAVTTASTQSFGLCESSSFSSLLSSPSSEFGVSSSMTSTGTASSVSGSSLQSSSSSSMLSSGFVSAARARRRFPFGFSSATASTAGRDKSNRKTIKIE